LGVIEDALSVIGQSSADRVFGKDSEMIDRE